MTLKDLEQLLLKMQDDFNKRILKEEASKRGVKRLLKFAKNIFKKKDNKEISICNVKLGIGQTFKDAFPELPVDGWGYIDKSGLPAIVKIDVNDFNQNGISNCYFLSPLMTIADTDPEYITSNILHPELDEYGNHVPGKYIVFFRGESGENKSIWTKVHVNSMIDEIQNQSGPDGDIWVALIEKAYSYYRKTENSFTSTNYGHPSSVFSNFGLDVKSLSLASPNNIKELTNLLKNNNCLTVCSGLRPIKNLVPQHAYGIRSINNQLKDGVIKIRNPWGQKCENIETELSSAELSTFHAAQVGVFPNTYLKSSYKKEVKSKMLYTLPNNHPYMSIDAVQVGGKYREIDGEKCIYHDNAGDCLVFIIKIKEDISTNMIIKYSSDNGSKLGLDISGISQPSIIASQTNGNLEDISIKIPTLKTDLDGIHIIKLYSIISGILIHSIRFA